MEKTLTTKTYLATLKSVTHYYNSMLIGRMTPVEFKEHLKHELEHCDRAHITDIQFNEVNNGLTIATSKNDLSMVFQMFMLYFKK